MNVLKTEHKVCPCCTQEHVVQTVEVQEDNIFKDEYVEYTAEYSYCDRYDEYFASGRQMKANDIRMKDAYRQKKGLLTSQQINDIRERYRISQSDLSLLLGWGGKTITRYESHQVQDVAHDTILRKLAEDPAWFLKLPDEKRD